MKYELTLRSLSSLGQMKTKTPLVKAHKIWKGKRYKMDKMRLREKRKREGDGDERGRAGTALCTRIRLT